MTKAHSIVYRLYLATALLALALSGHYTLEAYGGIIAGHMQDQPAHAPSEVSERPGCVASSGLRSRLDARACPTPGDIHLSMTDPVRR
jgi:hypothetical protein